jgi:hypothetical protein
MRHRVRRLLDHLLGSGHGPVVDRPGLGTFDAVVSPLEAAVDVGLDAVTGQADAIGDLCERPQSAIPVAPRRIPAAIQ